MSLRNEIFQPKSPHDSLSFFPISFLEGEYIVIDT